MKRPLLLALVAGIFPAALGAQSAPPRPVSDAPGVDALRSLWEQVTTNLTRAAEEMPEAKYSFRPTPEVRTFGQLIGHVAGAQLLMCSAALAEKGGNEDDVEKAATTKAALVSALKESTAYCARAYKQGEATLAGETQLFGQAVTRMYAIGLNAVHNGEHYGNIVTYLRINGMVPPSSRPSR